MPLALYPYDIAGYSELVSDHGKACLAGNSRSIVKRRNADHGRWQAHPQGATVVLCNCVTVLEREQPFPACCALLHNTTVALYPAISYG
ncbi:hypothetical protein [Nitrosomonas sp. Nm51]|uniref:hypothetical protein n=1 Tax=Nitrosomonas sp. Nm51 TaxID=133720 RepID=UPI00115FE0E3|nr:hypothetical protein [Nitrosomonas sp. Nm51]